MNVKELREAIANLPDGMPVMGYWEDEDLYYDLDSAEVVVYDFFQPLRKVYPRSEFPDPVEALMLT